MNKILEKIIARKKGDLLEKKKRLSLNELRGQIKGGSGSGLFYKAITKSINDPAIIAEVKLASPTGGDMGSSKDLLKRVKQYESAGADAISIITEPHFFKGSVDFIGKVKEAVKLPILQKDFVIDEYQIYEATLLCSDQIGATARQGQTGADALLLIARLVDNKTLERFVEICLEKGIEPVVEIYSEEDLEKAIETESRFIAVNSRDLDTFDVDVRRACKLMKKIPDRFVRLGFSGIRSEEEVRQYRKAGARGILIGTSLMKAKNIGEFLERIMK